MDHQERTYEQGWVPDADEVNCPPNALLRMDNLILDELGVLALRRGSTKINTTALADVDIHSLFTVVRSGTRLRYVGASNAVYRNGTSIASGVNGSNDIYFGSHMGQTLIARGTTKLKDDGTTVRNLGIAMTGGAPTINAALAARSKQVTNWDISETANHFIDEDDGTGLSYNQDHDGTANGALVLRPSNTTLRGMARRAFGADQDFANYTGPVAGADSDLFSTWIFIENSAVAVKVKMLLDVNDGSFQLDYYFKEWQVGGTAVSSVPATNPGGSDPAPNDPGSDPSNPPLI